MLSFIVRRIKLTFVIILLSVSICNNALGQSYNQEKVALTNFLVRMYKAEPFEGVKVVSDYDNNYLLSVVVVTPSKTPSATNRIAQVKSQRQVSQYLGGLVSVESETIIRTTEKDKEEKTIEEVVDVIREHSIGYTKAMEVLSVFDTADGQKCYMFYRKVEEMQD